MKKRVLLFLSVGLFCSCKNEKETREAVVRPAKSSSVLSRSSSSSQSHATRTVSLGAPPPRDEVLVEGDWGFVSRSGVVFISGESFPAEISSAIKELQTHSPSRYRDTNIRSLISHLMESDPQSAKEHIENWEDALISKWLNVTDELLQKLAKENPQEAIDFIQQSVPLVNQAARWTVFLREIPVAERAEYLTQMKEGKQKLVAASEMLHPWLAANPVDATRWLDEFVTGRSEGELRPIRDRRSYQQIKPVAAPSAMEAYRLSQNDEARKLLAEIAWKNADEESRDLWFSELSESLPDLMDQFWKEAVHSDPGGTARSLDQQQIAELNHRVARDLFSRWGEVNPNEALEWGIAHQRPEVATVLSNIYSVDPREVLAVAKRLPRGKELDRELRSITRIALIEGRLGRARELLSLISTPKLREQVEEQLQEAL